MVKPTDEPEDWQKFVVFLVFCGIFAVLGAWAGCGKALMEAAPGDPASLIACRCAGGAIVGAVIGLVVALILMGGAL
jgi:hypothetical protein